MLYLPVELAATYLIFKIDHNSNSAQLAMNLVSGSNGTLSEDHHAECLTVE
jgi:hypothetical protein